MKLFRVGLGAALLLTVVAPSWASEAIDRVVDQARQDCSDFEDGVLQTTDELLTLIDVTGDGEPDEVVDAHGFHCTTGSLFCGTGGCPLTVIVDNTPTEFLAKAWTVIEWGEQPILLLEVHGSECGGTNLRTCFEAVVWSEDGFRTVNQE